MVTDSDKLAEGRSFATGLRNAAAWFNRLERLVSALDEHGSVAAAVLEGEGHEDEADALRHAMRNLSLELFGDDGTDHPDAADVSDEPMVAPDLFTAAYALTQASEAIAAAGGALKVDGPVSDEDVTAFSTALYEVQAACRTLVEPDKSEDP